MKGASKSRHYMWLSVLLLGDLSAAQHIFVQDVFQSPKPAPGSAFGSAFTITDMNGDRFGDLVAFSKWAEVRGQDLAGRGWVMFGPDFERSVPIRSNHPFEGEEMGGSGPPAIGDVDGDGQLDVLIGAFMYSADDLERVGRAHLFYGPDFKRQRRFMAPEPQEGAEFGYSVLLMDVTGDGLDDVLVGVPRAKTDPDSPQDEVGRVVYWDANRLDEPLYLDSPRQPDPVDDSEFGRSLDRGDLDGDGVEELLIGAPDMLFLGQGRGYLFVYSVPSLSLTEIIETPSPPVGPGSFGGQLVWFGDAIHVGDLSGDAIPDILVTAPGSSYGSPATKGVVVRLDGPDFAYSGSVVPPDLLGQKEFGRAAAAADFDLDGSLDVIVGDPQWELNWSGQAWVVWGPDFKESQALNDFTFPGLAFYGQTVGVGDSDADGWPEAYVHWPGSGGALKGAVVRYELATVQVSSGSLSSQEPVHLDVDLGPSRANSLILAIPSLAGRHRFEYLPGGYRLQFPVDEAILSQMAIGFVDLDGRGSLEFTLPPVACQRLAGQTMTIAVLTVNSSMHLGAASNVVQVLIEP